MNFLMTSRMGLVFVLENRYKVVRQQRFVVIWRVSEVVQVVFGDVGAGCNGDRRDVLMVGN